MLVREIARSGWWCGGSSNAVEREREMANQGAKKRREENKQHMTKLIRLIVASNAIYALVRMLLFYSSTSWKHWFGLLVTSAAYLLPYLQLSKMATPSYSEDGELLDGGFDMASDGICGYLHDVIYITVFVQMASIISDKFWYTYLVIPAFGAYKISGLLKAFLPGSQGDEEDEKTKKKREKMERKASRTKFVRSRNRRSPKLVIRSPEFLGGHSSQIAPH